MGLDFKYFYSPVGFSLFADDFRLLYALAVRRHELRPKCFFICYVGGELVRKEFSSIRELVRDEELTEFDALIDSKTFELVMYQIKSPFCRAMIKETYIDRSGFVSEEV